VKALYFDCFAGASGDMILGALIDAGVPMEELRRAVGSLAVEGWEISAERVLKQGLSATRFRVHEHAHAHTHGRAEPAHHHHHSLSEIERAIGRSALSDAGKARAVRMFRRLAEVEADIHGTTIDRVHLHEVGALDSIIDIVGAVFAFEWMRAARVVCSPLNVGGGVVRSAHGVFPVPAPATVRLLREAPAYSSGVQAELLTPTGALVLTEYASSFGPLPAMRVEKVGYGAGDRDVAETPNVLRVFVGEAAHGAPAMRIVTMECEIDDMNPQIFGALMDRLYAEGALEVFYSAVQMKKNRPGTLVTVVARPEAREALSTLLFRETTTIGVRYLEMWRDCLDREIVTVTTPAGPVRFKVSRREGQILNAQPEFEDLARLATESGLPIKDVQALAQKAWIERGGQ
jgi:hypothetical protein